MKIVGASLANRFYKSDGWTRKSVAALLNDQREELVEVRDQSKDCIYFSVYQNFVKGHVAFINDLIKVHEYEPYSNENFDRKNKVVYGPPDEEILHKVEIKVFGIDTGDETVEALIPSYSDKIQKILPVNYSEFSMIKQGSYMARVNIGCKNVRLKVVDWDFESYKTPDFWETL